MHSWRFLWLKDMSHWEEAFDRSSELLFKLPSSCFNAQRAEFVQRQIVSLIKCNSLCLVYSYQSLQRETVCPCISTNTSPEGHVELSSVTQVLSSAAPSSTCSSMLGHFTITVRKYQCLSCAPGNGLFLLASKLYIWFSKISYNYLLYINNGRGKSTISGIF